MAVDLSQYRTHPREIDRIARIFDLVPTRGKRALDIGARDGHLSRILAERFDHVVALDLNRPEIDDRRIECVQGDATALTFADRSFDTVVCAEVLEHVPAKLLDQVGREIVRVTAGCAIVGVPYRQDLRVACTTCSSCGKSNPPWGHVNSFDEQRLTKLLSGLSLVQTDFVGHTNSATNALSVALLNYAGNPFGTYEQDEDCTYCAAKLVPPMSRNPSQKVATRVASWINALQSRFTPQRGNWLHMRFDRLAT